MMDEIEKMDATPLPRERETVRYTRTLQALSAGRLEEAIHRFKTVIREVSQACGGIDAARQALLEEMQRGEEGLTLAIEQQKKNFEIRSQRALLRLARAILVSLTGGDAGKDCKLAFEDANVATSLRTDDVYGRINRANVLFFSARCARDLGKDVGSVFDMAKADLDHGHKLVESHPTLLHNLGIVYFYLASVDKKTRTDPCENYRKAIEYLRQASEFDPTYAYVFKDLGVCRIALARVGLEKGERPRDLLRTAVGDLSMAIELNPKLYGAYYERGMGFFSLKQFQNAVLDWEVCLSLDGSKKGHLEPLIREARLKLAANP